MSQHRAAALPSPSLVYLSHDSPSMASQPLAILLLRSTQRLLLFLCLSLPACPALSVSDQPTMTCSVSALLDVKTATVPPSSPVHPCHNALSTDQPTASCSTSVLRWKTATFPLPGPACSSCPTTFLLGPATDYPFVICTG